MNKNTDIDNGLGLIMSGGGARAAYQVGFLRALSRHYPDINFPYITGVSSGAINAAFIANESGNLEEKINRLIDIWSNLTIDHVFRVDSASILAHVLRWGLRLMLGGASNAIETRSLVDTEPLKQLLEDILRPEQGVLKGIDRNILAGKLKAIAITASSYTTGQSISWVHGRDIQEWERGHRKSIISDLTIDHILASASLPILFPSVYINGSWFGDGGIRLTAPLAPAIHMGANRLLAISTRHISPDRSELQARIDDYPSPAKVMGAMYSAIFLDVFDNDALRLERINHLLNDCEGSNTENLDQVKLLLLRPSEDLGNLAAQYEPQLPRAFRFMTRGWGTREYQSADMLSLVMFQPDYLQHLIRMGEQDAESKMEEIHAFLSSS